MPCVTKLMTIYHQLITRTTPNKMLSPMFFYKAIALFILGTIYIVYGILCMTNNDYEFQKKFLYRSPALENYKVGVVKKYGRLINYKTNIRDPEILAETQIKTVFNFEIENPVPKMDVYISMDEFSQNTFTYLKQSPQEQIKTGKIKHISQGSPFKMGEDGQVIFPAGIVAQTFMQDDFTLYYKNEEVPVRLDGIAKHPVLLSKENLKKLERMNVVAPTTWQGNILNKNEKDKDKDKDKNDLSGVADVNDPRFQVWIQPHALGSFTKLWGQYYDLKPGSYRLVVVSTFPYGKNKRIEMFESRRGRYVINGSIKGSFMVAIGVLAWACAVFYYLLCF